MLFIRMLVGLFYRKSLEFISWEMRWWKKTYYIAYITKISVLFKLLVDFEGAKTSAQLTTLVN